MIKNTLLIGALFCLSFASTSQTTATDFTVDDCSGTTHNLFDELDDGKVIVIAWTMPCFSCIAPCLTAQDAVYSFNTSHADRVKCYLVDDYADTDCATIVAWGESNGFAHVDAYFSDAAISMDDYGIPGMPKIVVLGCTGHKVFYNGNLSVSYDDIQAAIEEALSAEGCVSSVVENDPILDLSLYPNPSKNKMNLSYTLPEASSVDVEIYNCTGVLIESLIFDAQGVGSFNRSIDVTNFAEGMYFIKVKTNTSAVTVKFIVSR
ncbi:MAG: T9SS type A sorting domain-containing protein [Crocinitomix sp.]|nr:T9SS type A sorting domain-containing protein [Crocinitomix sp.]